MARQLDEAQFYAAKAAMRRVIEEAEEAYNIIFGTKPEFIKAGAHNVVKNNNQGKTFTPRPPVVTQDHQDAIDKIDPDTQATIAAQAQVDTAEVKKQISNEPKIISSSANGMGSYYATVECPNTRHRASIEITDDEYDELEGITEEDNISYELSKEQIEAAEWEPPRGLNEEDDSQCDCDNQVKNSNPYNDDKIEAEIAINHTALCAYWNRNTVTFTDKGAPCYVALERLGREEENGFDVYMEGRKKLLYKIANGEIIQDADNPWDAGVSPATIFRQLTKMAQGV
jgi:hypothetical protein